MQAGILQGEGGGVAEPASAQVLRVTANFCTLFFTVGYAKGNGFS